MKKVYIGFGIVALILVVFGVGLFLVNRGSVGKSALPAAITQTVQGDASLQAAIKGDKGEKGLQGEKGDKGKDGAQGPQGEKGDKGKDGVDGKDGKDGVCDASTCQPAKVKVVKKPAPVAVKKPGSVDVEPKAKKEAEPAAKGEVKATPVVGAPAPVAKTPEPAAPALKVDDTARVQIYQPITVTMNGQPVNPASKGDAVRTNPLAGTTITNHGTMVVAPVVVDVGQ